MRHRDGGDAPTREEHLQAIAEKHGWQFSIEDPADLRSLPFRYLANGEPDSQVAMDVLWGTSEGTDFIAFDFSYGTLIEDLPGVDTPSVWKSSCAVAAVRARCPELMISHETLGHWLEHPRHHEIFEHESAEFARSFRITTTDHAFATALFDDEVVRWFLAELQGTDLCFEFFGPWLMCFTRQRPPDEMHLVIDGLHGFRERIPATVYDRWGLDEASSAHERMGMPFT